jgi:hypothetical protein
MRYRVDFADGWANDRVVVSVGGREVCRLDDVTTRPATNLARSVDVEVADGPEGPGGHVDLQIEVSDRALKGSYPLTPDRSLVVVNVGADGLAFSSPSGPYGYA